MIRGGAQVMCTRGERVVVRGAILAALLGALYVLREVGATTLLAWTERCFPVDRYPALFAAYFATWLALRAAGDRHRRVVMLAGSLVTALIFDPGFLAAALVWIVGLHRVLFSASPRRVAYALAYVLLTFVGLGVVANYDLAGDWLEANPFVARWAYVFALSFTFRIAWLLHEVRVYRPSSLPLADIVTYFVFAPFFVIVPYMLAIPRCDRFRAGLARHDLELERSGLRLIVWGIVLTCALAALREVIDIRAEFEASLARRDLVAFLVTSPLNYPLRGAIEAIAIAAILVGLVRVLGIDLAPAFDRPLAAHDLAEWWRRWNLHFRDLLVALFYNPVVLRLRRRPERAIVVGCIWVFLVGSVLFHLPKFYFRRGELDVPPLALIVENVIVCVLVAIALVRERRRPRPRPRGARLALAMLITWMLVLASNVWAGGGVQSLVQSEPTPPAPWSLEFLP